MLKAESINTCLKLRFKLSWRITVCIGDSTGDLLLVLPGADDSLEPDVETTNED